MASRRDVADNASMLGRVDGKVVRGWPRHCLAPEEKDAMTGFQIANATEYH